MSEGLLVRTVIVTIASTTNTAHRRVVHMHSLAWASKVRDSTRVLSRTPCGTHGVLITCTYRLTCERPSLDAWFN